MAKKVVVKLQINDCRDKQKAMKSVSTLCGIDTLTVDLKDQKLTVVGDIDPIEVMCKLRKCWQAEMVTFGPEKEPEKGKKGEEKKGEDKKKEEAKKKTKPPPCRAYYPYPPPCRGYYPYPPPCNSPPPPQPQPQPQPCYNTPHCYSVCCSEDYPNGCRIC